MSKIILLIVRYKKMKKILTMLLLLIMVFAVSSCQLLLPDNGDQTDDGKNEEENKENEGGNGEEEQKPEPDNLIFNKDSELYFVYNPEEFDFTSLEQRLYDFTNIGIYPRPVTPDYEVQKHEIVLGTSGRQITKDAKMYLERMDLKGEEETRYCIYSDGSSVAIVFDDDIGDFTVNLALDYFVNNYLSEEVCIPKGVVKSDCFDLYEYLGEQDTLYYEKYWKSVSEKLGEDGKAVVDALQSFYSLYEGEKIITWLMNLYDPSICVCHGLDGDMECKKNNKYCGTGGFYYSNSARDNVGFLPDAESCAQALSIIGNCGITTGLKGYGYSAVVPKEMADQICRFIYNLQEPDGFFYHPQWEKNISDSRRGRDLSWCNGILHTWNYGKKYTSASTYELLPEENMTDRLQGSKVEAVSKVISTAAVAVAPHLETLEAFEKYIREDLDIYNKSYSAGNSLSAQSAQIIARGPEYEELLMDILTEVYNYHGNGTWHHKVNYYAINGVMKISGQFTSRRIRIPNVELTCRAAFAAIGSDEEVKDIVDIWNPWVAFNNCIDNIETCDGAEAAEAMRNELLASYAEAVIDTRDKLALFKKADGSFSYKQKSTSTTSQGAHVSVAGYDEGDVNATVIGTNNFTYELFQILPVGRVSFCRTKERLIFLNMVEDLTPIRKQGTSAEIDDPIDFDWDEVGYAPVDVAVSADGSDSERGGKVIVDPREDKDGNVMQFISKKGAGDNFVVNASGRMVGATCQIFEGEFCFEDINNGANLFRIEFGNGSDNSNTYRMETRVSNGKIEFYDNSSRDNYPKKVNKLGISVNEGEWFKLRVEYYVGDHDSVRIKIYFNDKLAVVTDNYYDYKGIKITEGVGVPNARLKNTRFYMLIDCQVTLLCDNLHCYNNRDEYKPEALHEDFKDNLNVDARLLVEEGLEAGKRMPVMDLTTVKDEEAKLSTLDLINEPTVVVLWDNLSKDYLIELDTLLREYGDEFSIYAVCAAAYKNSAMGYINNNLSDSTINFVLDERVEGEDKDTYFSLVGGTESYPRVILLNKDGIIHHVADGRVDTEELSAMLDTLLGK